MADTTFWTALVLNQITDEFGIPQDDVVFRGGGKGQRASASGFSTADGMLTGKGTTRTAAAHDLLVKIREFYAAITAAEATTKARATIEQAIETIRVAFPDLDIFEEDDDRAPAPVWQDIGGMPVLVAIVPCVGECMQGQSDVCDCRCMGANHGLMRLGMVPTWGEVKALQPVRFGPKECLCGCAAQLQPFRGAPGSRAQARICRRMLPTSRNSPSGTRRQPRGQAADAAGKRGTGWGEQARTPWQAFLPRRAGATRPRRTIGWACKRQEHHNHRRGIAGETGACLGQTSLPAKRKDWWTTARLRSCPPSPSSSGSGQ
jgi:hypothetical protein